MDERQIISAVCIFVECRVRDDISYDEMARSIGLSYRRIREIFKTGYGISLTRYILIRRINNTAFKIAYTKVSLTDIAYEFGFNSQSSRKRL